MTSRRRGSMPGASTLSGTCRRKPPAAAHSLRQRRDLGPTVLPLDRRDRQDWPAALGIVGVEDQVIAVAVLQDRLVSRSVPLGGLRLDDQAAAIFQQRLSAVVDIGSGDILRAADYD